MFDDFDWDDFNDEVLDEVNARWLRWALIRLGLCVLFVVIVLALGVR